MVPVESQEARVRPERHGAGTWLGLVDDPGLEYSTARGMAVTAGWSPLVVGLTACAALLVGFLFSIGLSAGRTSAHEQDARKERLVELILARQRHTQELAAEVEGLRERVAEVEGAATMGLTPESERLRAVEVAAGTTPVAGPGITLTLSDAPEGCSEQPEDCQIQDTDVQLAVNRLFAVGAEAVAVNGERLVATSAIRRAGRSVLVNYRVLTSPYVIEAIGDPDSLQRGLRRSELGRDFAVWTDVYGLGFQLEASDELQLPAYQGGLDMGTATPGQERSP